MASGPIGGAGAGAGAGRVRDVYARFVLRDICPRAQRKDESAGLISWNSIMVSAFPHLQSHGLTSRNAPSCSPRPSSTTPGYRTTFPALCLSRTDNGGLRARTVFLLTRSAMRRRVTTLAFAQGHRRACSQRNHTYHGNRTPRTDPITVMARGAAAGLARLLAPSAPGLPAPASPGRERIPPGLS